MDVFDLVDAFVGGQDVQFGVDAFAAEQVLAAEGLAQFVLFH